MFELQLDVIDDADGRRPVRHAVRRVLIAGYTGRDRSSVMDHIRELQQLGVAPPPRLPMVYEVDPALLTTEPRLLASSPRTSGEVEFVLLPTPDGLLIGVGSDHTDRQHEAIDVATSKSMCAKPVSAEVWRYQDVCEHWDLLQIRSWVTSGAGRVLYQDGCLDAFLPVDDLLAELRQAGYGEVEECVIFGGTIPTQRGFVYGSRFEAELHDPVRRRSLSVAYHVELADGSGGG